MTRISEYLRRGEAVNFSETKQAALGYLPSLVRTWLPDGRRCGNEWVSVNPTRPDKSPGSFSVNSRLADGLTSLPATVVATLFPWLRTCSAPGRSKPLAPWPSRSDWRCGHERHPTNRQGNSVERPHPSSTTPETVSPDRA